MVDFGWFLLGNLGGNFEKGTGKFSRSVHYLVGGGRGAGGYGT